MLPMPPPPPPKPPPPPAALDDGGGVAPLPKRAGEGTGAPPLTGVGAAPAANEGGGGLESSHRVVARLATLAPPPRCWGEAEAVQRLGWAWGWGWSRKRRLAATSCHIAQPRPSAAARWQASAGRVRSNL